MLNWVLLAVGLLGGTARANDVAGSDADPTLQAALLGGDNPVEAVKSDADKKREERLAALEASQSHKTARVVVLQWKGQDTDYTNETLVRNVKTRIARPDAKFYPEVDLYQAGRKEPDKSIRPADQRGSPPDAAIAEVTSAVDQIATVPWNAMSESDWGLKANELRDLSNKIWFIDRPELREPLFKLYVQIGRSAENQNNPAPPFYEQVGNLTVNWYWYLAGAMAHEEPGLMAKLTDQDLYGSIDYYKQLLDSGKIQPMTLAFSEDGKWDPKVFAGDYQVFLNGIEILIDDKDSLYKVPPGRVDLYLKRDDGMSLSDEVDITKLEDKIYFVRDVARKKMGLDFIDQLMEHPNECSPELDGDILNYLAIYARLHPESEIYVSVPEAGNPNRILIWRWDRPSGTLQKVLDNTGGFPVRFAVLGGTGMLFNGASVSVTAPSLSNDGGTPTATPPSGQPSLQPSAVPFNGQLRGHYGRFMGLVGIEGDFNITGEKWMDYYQIDDDSYATNGDTLAIKQRMIARELYTGAGVVLKKDAAIGFGPRGYFKFGQYNVPHVLDMSLHAGLTTKGPMGNGSRVQTLIDVDAFGGVLMGYGDSVQKGSTSPNLGLVASAGVTF